MNETIKEFEFAQKEFLISMENYLSCIKNQGNLLDRYLCNYEHHNIFYKNVAQRNSIQPEENITNSIFNNDSEMQLEKILPINHQQNGIPGENDEQMKRIVKHPGKTKENMEKTPKINHAEQHLNATAVSSRR